MSLVQQIVEWFGASNARYWAVAASGMASVVSLALVAAVRDLRSRSGEDAETAWWQHPLFFIALLAVALMAFRWPTVFYPHELNGDESVRVAEAMKFLRVDPIPWRGMDTGTSGPLNAYALVLPALLGLPLDYATARLMGLLFTAVTLSFTYLTLRIALQDGVARMTVLPLFVFYCLTRYVDFVHYASEPLAVMLLSAAVYLLTDHILSGTERPGLLFAAGLALGAVPFAKLQAAPVAAFLFLGGGAAAAVRKKYPGRSAMRPLVMLCCGAVIVPVGIFSMIFWGRVFGDFWTSYILGGLGFTESTAAHPFRELIPFFGRLAEFLRYFKGNVVLVAGGLVGAATFGSFERRYVTRLLAALLYCAVTAYIVLAPGREHDHYLLFLIAPLALLSGLMFGSVVRFLAEQGRTRVAAIFLLTLLGFSVVMQIGRGSEYYSDTYFLKYAREYFAEDPSALLDPRASALTAIILRTAGPGEKMAIWGWTPKYYMMTGLLPGTREANTQCQVEESPLRDYYRRRFLNDLRTARPTVFMDTVSSIGWHFCDRERYGHETFRELAEFIRSSYTLVFEFGPSPNDAVRVYVRNDRVRR